MPTFHEIIASLGFGHSYNKHVVTGREFSSAAYGSPTTINSQQDFANHIQDVINAPDTRAIYGTRDNTVIIYNEKQNVIIMLNSSQNNGDAGTVFRVQNPERMTTGAVHNKQMTQFQKKIESLEAGLGPEVFRANGPAGVKATVEKFGQSHTFSRTSQTQIASTDVQGARTVLEGRGAGATPQEVDDFNRSIADERARIARPGELMTEIRDRARAGATITDNGNVRTITPLDPAQPHYEITTTKSGSTVKITTAAGEETVTLTKAQTAELSHQVVEHKTLGIRERLMAAMKTATTKVDAEEKFMMVETEGGRENYSITKNDDGTLHIDVEDPRTGAKIDTVNLSAHHSKDLAKQFRTPEFVRFPNLRKFATSVVLAVGLSIGGATDAQARPLVQPERPAIIENQATRRETPIVEDSPASPKPLGPDVAPLPEGSHGKTTGGVEPEGPTTLRRPVTGGGGDVPHTRNTGNIEVETPNRSRWQQAVEHVGGAKGVAAHIAGGAGYGLSAFSLSQQLFGENSTLKSDLKNDAVRTRAITAVSLDAAVFTTDTIIYGANAAKYLRHLDKLDDLARVASASSKLSKFSRVAGPVGTAVAVVTTGIQYSIAETLEDGRRAAEAVGGGAGGLGGAGIGAGIGVWFGGPVGAGVGAIIGGLVGGFGGAKVAEHYWADDFQEHFDEKALQRQRENLDRLKGLGDDLDKFVKLEETTMNAYKRLADLYESTDISKMDHQQVLAIDASKLREIDNALAAYTNARRELARNIDSAMLSQGDQGTLDQVMQFIQERKAFLVEKEKHLTETGDQAALARLATDRAGLLQAEQTIARWKGLNQAITAQYGNSSREGLQKAEAELAPTIKSVAERKTQITDYQDKIRKYQAAQEQQRFEGTLKQRVDKVNTLYNSGQTDDALMQKSAALLSLVESGAIDAETFAEASADISAVRTQHGKDLADMNRLKGNFWAMTKSEQGHQADPYKKDYAGHNLTNFRAINLRMKEITGSYKVSEDIASHTLKAAESAVAVRAAIESGQELTGQAATTISGHIVNIAGHTTETLALLSQDLDATAKTLHGEWTKQQSSDVVNISRYLDLRTQSVQLIEGIDHKVAEIDRYQRSLKDTLENGYQLGETRVPVSDSYNRQRMQEIIDRLEKLKIQYNDQSNKILQDIDNATSDVHKRVLQRGDATITLDRKGMVATYTVGEKTITFGRDRRPMLVDENAHIYNNATSLQGAEGVDFYLYRWGVLTEMGETFQGTKAQDAAQLRTIEDADERAHIQQEERELAGKLKGKTIRNAISEMPAPLLQVEENNSPQEEQDGHSSIQADSEDELSVASSDLESDADYIEGAIALEKAETGEVLDDMEKAALKRILDNSVTDPSVIAALTSRYSNTIQELNLSSSESNSAEGVLSRTTYALGYKAQTAQNMGAVS